MFSESFMSLYLAEKCHTSRTRLRELGLPDRVTLEFTSQQRKRMLELILSGVPEKYAEKIMRLECNVHKTQQEEIELELLKKPRYRDNAFRIAWALSNIYDLSPIELIELMLLSVPLPFVYVLAILRLIFTFPPCIIIPSKRGFCEFRLTMPTCFRGRHASPRNRTVQEERQLALLLEPILTGHTCPPAKNKQRMTALFLMPVFTFHLEGATNCSWKAGKLVRRAVELEFKQSRTPAEDEELQLLLHSNNAIARHNLEEIIALKLKEPKTEKDDRLFELLFLFHIITAQEIVDLEFKPDKTQQEERTLELTLEQVFYREAATCIAHLESLCNVSEATEILKLHYEIHANIVAEMALAIDSCETLPWEIVVLITQMLFLFGQRDKERLAEPINAVVCNAVGMSPT